MSSFTDIYMVRHTHTQYLIKSEAIHGGDYDGEEGVLTELGKTQAADLGNNLGSLGAFSMIYHSPLKRTKETAEIINKQLKTKMQDDASLKEIRHGQFDHQLNPKVRNEFCAKYYKEQGIENSKDPMAKWKVNPMNAMAHFDKEKPEAETIFSLSQRIEAAFKRHAKANPNKKILEVSSQGAITTAMTLFSKDVETPYPAYYEEGAKPYSLPNFQSAAHFRYWHESDTITFVAIINMEKADKTEEKGKENGKSKH